MGWLKDKIEDAMSDIRTKRHFDREAQDEGSHSGMIDHLSRSQRAQLEDEVRHQDSDQSSGESSKPK